MYVCKQANTYTLTQPNPNHFFEGLLVHGVVSLGSVLVVRHHAHKGLVQRDRPELRPEKIQS